MRMVDYLARTPARTGDATGVLRWPVRDDVAPIVPPQAASADAGRQADLLAAGGLPVRAGTWRHLPASCGWYAPEYVPGRCATNREELARTRSFPISPRRKKATMTYRWGASTSSERDR